MTTGFIDTFFIIRCKRARVKFHEEYRIVVLKGGCHSEEQMQRLNESGGKVGFPQHPEIHSLRSV